MTAMFIFMSLQRFGGQGAIVRVDHRHIVVVMVIIFILRVLVAEGREVASDATIVPAPRPAMGIPIEPFPVVFIGVATVDSAHPLDPLAMLSFFPPLLTLFSSTLMEMVLIMTVFIIAVAFLRGVR